jgi:hypothetical protein
LESATAVSKSDMLIDFVGGSVRGLLCPVSALGNALFVERERNECEGEERTCADCLFLGGL